MPHNNTLYALHDIEEFLRSLQAKKQRAGGLSLYHSADLNRREKDILSFAKTRGIKCRELEREQFYEQVKKEFGKEKPSSLRHMFMEVPGDYLESRRSGGDLLANVEKLDSPSLLLVLDGVTDPHNLGAILRSADLMEVDGVILPKRRSAEVNDTVRAVSAGASHHVEVYNVPNLSRILQQLKDLGYWIYSADLGGKRPDSLKLSGKTVLVLGSEGKGVSPEITKNSDESIAIPSGGHIDSFNVSVAAGILMYEIRRQSNFPFKNT